jgi:Ca-activated chloride channel family protein
MRFAHPPWLALLWLAPAVFALAVLGIRRRGRNLREYARVPSRIALGRHEGRRWQGAVLAALAVGLVAFAVAGPQLGFHWRTSERRGVDLIVAVDCSRSMLAGDIRPSRLDRAKREVVDLLNRLQGDRVGLVAFAGTAFLQCPLTLDYSGLHLFLQALTPDYLPVGGTALDAAVETALAGFDRESRADRAVVLITDGEQTTGAAEAAAKKAAEAKVRLYVIGVGTPEGAPIPLPGGGFVKDAEGRIVLARLDEDALARLASSTGGRYVRSVPGDEDWQAIYDNGIRAELKARTLEANRVQVWHDRFQWPLFLAAIALAAELILPRGRRAATVALVWLTFGWGLLLPGRAAAERAGALVRRGLERYDAGDFAAAEKAFVEAQVEAPTAPEIGLNLGNAQYRAGKFEDALASYSAALREADDKLRPQVLYNRGNAAFRLGRLDDAVRDYQAALEADPKDRDARLNLEFARRKLEEQRKAQKQEQPQKGQQKGQSRDQPQQGHGSEPRETGDQRQKSGSQKEPEVKQDAGEEKASAGPDHPDQKKGGEQPPAEAAAGQPQGGAEGQAAQPTGGAEQRPEGGQNTAGKLQARSLLNRLQDEPGKALMPRYEKRRIEKDW